MTTKSPSKTGGHIDGSPCLKGTREAVPENYQPCCEAFERHTWSCHFDLRYEWAAEYNCWGINNPGAWIQIYFCPHCGTRVSPGAQDSGSDRVLRAPEVSSDKGAL
jgi:hypothetical protein